MCVHALLLLAMCTVSRSASPPGSFRVYHMQTDMFEPATNESYLRFDLKDLPITRQAPINKMTICYWLKFSLFRPSCTMFSYATSFSNVNTILLGQKWDEKLTLFYGGSSASEGLYVENLQDMPNQWAHYCHVFQNYTYKFYMNGEESANKTLESFPDIPLNGTVFIGQAQQNISRVFTVKESFSGHISQVRWWDKALSATEIRNIANCGSLPHSGNIIISSESLPGNMSSFTDVDGSIFCQKDWNYVFFGQYRQHDEAQEICQKIGGSMSVPHTLGHLQALFRESQQWSEQCHGSHRGGAWLGIDDKEVEGLWVDSNTQKPISNLVWLPGYPRGGSDYDCAALSRLTPALVDISCHNDLCFPCDISTMTAIYIRGLCYPKEHESKAYVVGHHNNYPYYVGYYDDVIYYDNNNTWVLWDRHRDIILAEWHDNENNNHPLGRHQWKLIHPVCHHKHNETILISLSKCNGDQFMCSNGICIELMRRCDVRIDCEDESDEQDCKNVFFPSNYKKYRPPSPSEYGAPLYVNVTLEVYAMSQFDEIEQTFNAAININSRWFDRSLRFYNLEIPFTRNPLEPEEREKLWTPEIELVNVKGSTSKKLKTLQYIIQLGPSDLNDHNDAQMNNIFSGSSALLTKSEIYSGDFSCKFNLFRYPFDTQYCTVDIVILSGGIDIINFDAIDVSYKAETILNSFQIIDYHSSKYDVDGFGRASARFTLRRRYGVLLMSIFLPTLMLFSIAYSTLYIKISKLQVRATMALMTLLVVYTFFNQVSSSLPQTGSILMVDIWFFFFIATIFSLIVIHIVAEYLPSEEEIQKIESAEAKMFKSTNTTKTKKKPFLKRLTAEMLLRFARYIYVPLALTIFLCVFWISMLNG